MSLLDDRSLGVCREREEADRAVCARGVLDEIDPACVDVPPDGLANAVGRHPRQLGADSLRPVLVDRTDDGRVQNFAVARPAVRGPGAVHPDDVPGDKETAAGDLAGVDPVAHTPQRLERAPRVEERRVAASQRHLGCLDHELVVSARLVLEQGLGFREDEVDVRVEQPWNQVLPCQVDDLETRRAVQRRRRPDPARPPALDHDRCVGQRRRAGPVD
jgi:hypothetical protein